MSEMAQIHCAIAVNKIRKRPFFDITNGINIKSAWMALICLAIFEMCFANQHSVV